MKKMGVSVVTCYQMSYLLLLFGLLSWCRGVDACSGRVVLNATSGVITDGTGNYPASAHCEWLIDAGGSEQYISLEFSMMDTECSYDYLFVYAGDSYDDPMIGSYSGSTVPDKILSQGYMLIYFYSDRNYVRKGFDGRYTVTECAYNCSNHGVCDENTHLCACNTGYKGTGCEIEYCPDLCGQADGRGQCNLLQERCQCQAQYTGYDCSLPLDDTEEGQSTWYSLAPTHTALLARTGHAGCFIEATHSLYVFGGNTLNNLLKDLMRFNLTSNTWESLTQTSPWPSERYAHAIVAYDAYFYMFGGILSNGSHSNELWLYTVADNTWTLMATASPVMPPAVASHALTLVENKWLYLFGGRTENSEFVSNMFRYNVLSGDVWEEVIPRGGKEADRRLVGHSMVYHTESKSLLVFGGFLPDYARFPKRTNGLHAFHIDERYWSQIQYEDLEEDPSQPKDRAFHTANIMGNYMVIYGGNYHIHHQAEVCYDANIYFYHLGCHRWVDLTDLQEAFPASSDKYYGGRFSHISAVAYGNILLVAGGYRGNVMGDTIAFKVPLAIAKNKFDVNYVISSDHCGVYDEFDLCKHDPECIWCTDMSCIHHSRAQECGDDYVEDHCPGICAGLYDCNSCAVQGQGASLDNSNIAELRHNVKCAWCVKDSTCQKLSEPHGFCNPDEPTLSLMDGWWGKNSSFLTTLDQCRVNDFPAGLHWIKYRHPPNLAQPDEVEIVRTASMNFQFDPIVDEENILGSKYTARFQGFIWPLGAESSNGSPLKMYLVSVSADAKLWLSTDASPDNKELVCSLIMGPYINVQAHRLDGSEKVFPHEERGYKYYMEQKAEQAISGKGTNQVASTMQLEWSGALRDTTRIRQPFTAEFMEPYNSESCHLYKNCLACMTDTGCGWCVTSNTCVVKTDTAQSAELCGPVSGAHYLITNATQCSLCGDHITCEDCTQNELCEWLTSEGRCLRRGRFSQAVTNTSQCPLPCQDRSNCSWCLSERNECAWCEESATCFPFVEYMMRYAYGGCLQWVDNMSAQQCHDCSRHTTCKACIADFQCGWCGNIDNPTLGRCLDGDFNGPEVGPASTCPALVAEVQNVSASEASEWSYGICPDVEECRLGLHDCHDNATCHNTFESYICTCNRGYTGNGRDTCTRTCYYDCIHGTCSGPPTYTCNCTIGWTGEECNTNCGCHNHSTCDTGVGVCDSCQHWTSGVICELCKPGSYGDATTESGCIPCDCNGHGDETLGFCNNTTGQCYCKDNSMGDHCQTCSEGYYGNPENGGTCYLKCEGRTILGNLTYGALGSHAGKGVINKAHAYCLWIMTVHDDLNNLVVLNDPPTITFSMESDIKTICSKDYVYVYDGIPSFMTSSSSSSATLLASYCGYGTTQPLKVEAKTGYITVYFEGNIEQSSTSTLGFNATYHVNRCPDDCINTRECVSGKCVCMEGYGGIDCSKLLCPRNCSVNMGQGVCDTSLGQCVCSPGYGGDDCLNAITDSAAFYTSIYDPWRADGVEAFNSSLARMGHSLVSCDDGEGGQALYMFGGYSLSRGILNDLWKFEIDTQEWVLLRPATDDEPSPRYFHSAVCVPAVHAMFVFGGLVETAGAVKEMWRYNLDTNRWSKQPIDDPDEDWPIPPMAGHTMTLVDDTHIWIIGGFSSSNYFSEATYEYDASNNNWNELSLTGSIPTGLYGHTAVYHSSSDAIYVFGGYEYQTDKTVESNTLYSVDIRKNAWSILPSEVGNRVSERFLHAAASTDNYMVILGGRTTQHDYDYSVHAYRYRCNQWVDVTVGVERIYGEGIPAVIGASAVSASSAHSNHDDIYFMAGFNSASYGSLIKLTLPKDLCNLQAEKASCTSMIGCAACVDEALNKTYCYTNQDPSRFDCAFGTAWSYESGPVCDNMRIQDRDCTQHTTCAECLAQWPAHRGHDKVCQWCSNCPQGKCIPRGLMDDGEEECRAANPCKRTQRAIRTPDDCVERLCQASDCDKCWKKGTCIWTRQFKRTSEVARTLSLIPVYDWNCVVKSLLDATRYSIESSPPKPCPMRCYQFTNCRACLNSLGGEGGSQECVWSVHLQECMSPAYLPLHCSNGECGPILTGKSSQCPEACSIHTQCSSCLATPACGWCAYGGLNGLGLCMEGGLTGPKLGLCSAQNVTYGDQALPDRAFNWSLQAVGAPTWSFGQCPQENECTNEHHTCDASETCTDLPTTYRCDCKAGYVRDASNNKCKPDCKQRCEPHGDCVAPNICQCHFGYVGDNCSTECQCNKHSNCRSVQEKDVCIACQNNTQGQQCQQCKPLFVGNPINGGSCKSCTTFCNQHSTICLSEADEIHVQSGTLSFPHILSNISNFVSSGPIDESSAICINCEGFTQGSQCEDCRSGYFRLASKDGYADCQACQCNGHSNLCNKVDGINCDCKNNTKSPRCETNSDSTTPCYAQQCSECVDNFLGKPTEGHQCYRQMIVDRDYCFDPNTQMNCHSEPGPLMMGRSVFFGVQPKYLNVDIRVTLDVTSGGVDVYFSPFEDTYKVDVDPITGIHTVGIDPKFKYEDISQTPSLTRETRDIHRRSTSVPANSSSIHTEGDTEVIYVLEQKAATDFNTFIAVMHQHTFLVVRGVKHRLVITLPNGVHHLKTSRFYMVLLGTGSQTDNHTHGNLFFRQDQPHIDLFVFFSVFFSCFFKFLAICVLLWKLKQGFDARRSRHRRQLEMDMMASRPFARVSIIIEDPNDIMTVPLVPPPPRKSHGALPKFNSKYSLNSHSNDHISPEEKFTLRPITLEPTDDGVAAVGTFLFQMPGAACGAMQVSLGSALIQSSRQFQSTTQHHVHHQSSNSHPPKTGGIHISVQPSSTA